jgi:hypothetical protein
MTNDFAGALRVKTFRSAAARASQYTPATRRDVAAGELFRPLIRIDECDDYFVSGFR